ncbi:MAG: branched-chain amino acid ABC transporter permease [Candidatus Limnocylindrales bacterium]
MNTMARASSGLAPVGRWFGRHQSMSIIAAIAIVAVLLPYLILIPPFNGFGNQQDWVDGFANAGVFVLLAIGLNVVVGLSGLLDLGYAAFFAIGAYTYAWAASPFSGLHLPFWPMLIVGAIVAATFGLLLGAPTLRLRGDYLAIVTLGFGEIVPVVFLHSDKYTEGANGIGGVYTPSLLGYTFPIGDPWPYYATMAVILALVMIVVYRLQDSRLGRAWMAIREDELAAASMGINTVTTKLLAFAIGASTSGFAGVFLASKVTLVSTDSFHFDTSFTILAMVVLGGMGNIWGVAVGAFLVYELQTQGLKQLNQFLHPLNIPVLSSVDFLQYQFLIYGIVLVLMMLSRPEGLFPSRRRRAELHEEGAETAAEEVAPE